MIIFLRHRINIFFAISLFLCGNIFAMEGGDDFGVVQPFTETSIGKDENNFYLIVLGIADSIDLGQERDFDRAINDIQKWGSSCWLMRDQYKKFLCAYCSDDDQTDKEKLLRYLFRKRFNRNCEVVEQMSIVAINRLIDVYRQIFNLNHDNLNQMLAVNSNFFKSFVHCNDEAACNLLKKRLENLFTESLPRIKEIFGADHVEGQTHLTLAFEENSLYVCNFLMTLFEEIYAGENEILKELFNPTLASHDINDEDEIDDEDFDDLRVRKNLLWWTPLLGAIRQGKEGEFLAGRILDNLKNVYKEDKAGLLGALKKCCEDPRISLEDDGYTEESDEWASPLSFALRYSTFHFFERLFNVLEFACDNNLNSLKVALNKRRSFNNFTILMDACLGIEKNKKISYLIDVLYMIKRLSRDNVFVENVLCQNSSTVNMQRGTSVLLHVLEFCSAQTIDKFIELCDQSVNERALKAMFTEGDYRKLTALTLIISRCKHQRARCDKWLTVFKYMKERLFENDLHALRVALVKNIPNIEFCVEKNCLFESIFKDDLTFVNTVFEALRSVFKDDQDGYQKYLISQILGTKRNSKNVFQNALKRASLEVISRVYEELSRHVFDLRSFLLQKDYYDNDIMTFAIRRGNPEIIKFVFDIVKNQDESFVSEIFSSILQGLKILVQRNDVENTVLVCNLLREFRFNNFSSLSEDIFSMESIIEYIFASALRGNDVLHPLDFVKNGCENNSARNYLYGFFRELGIL